MNWNWKNPERFAARPGKRTSLLTRLEAAIGIEPMNKGFAVRPRPLSLSIMECHRPVFIDRFEEPCYSVTLKSSADSQKSPQSNSGQ